MTVKKVKKKSAIWHKKNINQLTILTEWILSCDWFRQFKGFTVTIGRLSNNPKLVLVTFSQFANGKFGFLGSFNWFPTTLLHVHLLNTVTTAEKSEIILTTHYFRHITWITYMLGFDLQQECLIGFFLIFGKLYLLFFKFCLCIS